MFQGAKTHDNTIARTRSHFRTIFHLLGNQGSHKLETVHLVRSSIEHVGFSYRATITWKRCVRIPRHPFSWTVDAWHILRNTKSKKHRVLPAPDLFHHNNNSIRPNCNSVRANDAILKHCHLFGKHLGVICNSSYLQKITSLQNHCKAHHGMLPEELDL